MKERGSKYYKRDPKQPGLLLRIRPSGHRCWYFRYSLHNRVRWYRIGQVGKTEARKIAARLRYEVAQGRDPQTEKLAQREAGTFGELHSRYISEWAQKRNKSWSQAAYLVERHLSPRWGRLDAKSITRADVRAALGRIASPTVANQTLAAASAIFTFGVKMEVVPFNPCRGIDGNPTKDRSRVLSDSELQVIWPKLTPPLRVVLLTGQRPGEVSCMRREHIVDKVWWQMPGPVIPALGWPGTKNKEDHRVFLSEPVRQIVGVGETGFAFESRSRLPRVIRGICAKLGITDRVRPHDLRRTFATFVTRLGHGRPAMDRILNHRDRSTGTIYDKYAYAMEDQRVMESVARHILEVAEGRRETGAVIRGTFLNEAS
jgi:integrase